LAGKVAAATAFWNDEGVTLKHDRPGFHVFRADSFGAPAYPELVLCASTAGLRRDHGLALAVARTLVAGYRFALRSPGAAARELEALVPGLDARLVSTQLKALLPAFRAPDGRVGVLDTGVLARWGQWEQRFGLVSHRPDIAAMFDPQLANTASAIGPFQ
jgi:NitT/TauT family transport system substrate-binding protein/putative hydroxymethylpyrimidine transport system substrate-binding protein